MVLRRGSHQRLFPFAVREKHTFSYGMITKEENNMITFCILAIVALIIAAIIAAILVEFGAGIIVVLGDLIVFALIIALIVKLFRRRK